MTDEQQIRVLFENWIKATTIGDIALARQCIANDAIFLIPGHGEMDKETFAQGAAGGSPEDSPMHFDLDSQIREIEVFGQYAYLWIQSTLLMSPKNGDPSSRMSGHSLSVLVKRNDQWQIYRDANTMAMESEWVCADIHRVATDWNCARFIFASTLEESAVVSKAFRLLP